MKTEYQKQIDEEAKRLQKLADKSRREYLKGK